MSYQNIKVVPTGDGTWKLKASTRGGDTTILNRPFTSRDAAIRAGINLADAHEIPFVLKQKPDTHSAPKVRLCTPLFQTAARTR